MHFTSYHTCHRTTDHLTRPHFARPMTTTYPPQLIPYMQPATRHPTPLCTTLHLNQPVAHTPGLKYIWQHGSNLVHSVVVICCYQHPMLFVVVCLLLVAFRHLMVISCCNWHLICIIVTFGFALLIFVIRLCLFADPCLFLLSISTFRNELWSFVAVGCCRRFHC